MTPAARVETAIGLIDRILGGTPAEQALTQWARASRYAGSGDRAAVRDHVYDALRSLRSFAAMGGAGGAPGGRQVMLGALRASGIDPDAIFTGAAHAPAALSGEERAFVPPVDLPPDMPDWLLPDLCASLGAALPDVLSRQRQRAPVFLRVNLARTTPVAAIAALAEAGVVAEPEPLADTALRISLGASKLRMAAPYLDGRVELQDAASQAAVAMLPLARGLRVLDYCAGGGGKVLAMAGRQAGMELFAHDAAPERMRDLPDRARRAGARVRQLSGAELARAGSFDLVLADVPCSGSGTWRRTPDAKWRLTREGLDSLCVLQSQILTKAAPLVRPGGVLAYMTCSLLRAENGDQVDAFLGRGDWSEMTRRQFLPADGGDGFFCAVLTRDS
jgi:16S rRNA (cytosine967-C5)-methyltransferase